MDATLNLLLQALGIGSEALTFRGVPQTGFTVMKATTEYGRERPGQAAAVRATARAAPCPAR